MKQHHPALDGFNSASSLLEEWHWVETTRSSLSGLRALITELQNGTCTAVASNLLLCMLTPLVKKVMRSTNTTLRSPDLVQEALSALFEVLSRLPVATLRSVNLMEHIKVGVRHSFLAALKRERRYEISRLHLQAYDSALRQEALTRRRAPRRKRCRVEADERPNCRALLAALRPDLLNCEDVEVWIATTIEGRSFREVALGLGGANSDCELAQLEGRLRQRKSRAGKKLQGFLKGLVSESRRQADNDDHEPGGSATLVALLSETVVWGTK